MKYNILYYLNRPLSICYYKEFGTAGGHFPHREDGPAFEDNKGTKMYYIKGLLHREDGPAVEFINGDKYWYWEGIIIDEETCKKRKADKDNWFGC